MVEGCPYRHHDLGGAVTEESGPPVVLGQVYHVGQEVRVIGHAHDAPGPSSSAANCDDSNISDVDRRRGPLGNSRDRGGNDLRQQNRTGRPAGLGAHRERVLVGGFLGGFLGVVAEVEVGPANLSAQIKVCRAR
jgi:hypothetical protein